MLHRCWSTKKKILWKSAIFHLIKLPFDAEVAEKILNGIYYTSVIGKMIFIYDFFLFFPDESGPAAMQHGNSANKFSFSLLSLFVIVNIYSMIHY